MNIDYSIIISNGDDRLCWRITNRVQTVVNKQNSEQARSFIFAADMLQSSIAAPISSLEVA